MQVTIEKLVYGGSGLARTDQGVVFVPRTAPGDVAEVELIEKKKDFANARLVRLIEASPDRQEPDCPNYRSAGCCHWQHIRYERQLDFKEAILRESLSRLARLPYDNEIRRIRGADHGYRLRAGFHVFGGRLGFVREHSKFVTPIERCASLSPELNAFIPAANAILRQNHFTRLREVDVWSGSTLGATLLFNDAGLSTPWERMRDALFAIPNLGALNFSVAGRRLHYVTQPPEIEVLGMLFRLTSEAFFQANRFLLGPFTSEVLAQCGASPQHVLELYSGSGFFSLPLARLSRELIGIEENRAAVKQAKDNAQRNQIENVEFAAGDVAELLANASLHPDLVLMNPPRSGAGKAVAEKVAELGAPKVVYVSCNPATFAREAVILSARGYRLKQVTLVDQFPNTYHIEFVAQFELE